jgi:hypothetical protein
VGRGVVVWMEVTGCEFLRTNVCAEKYIQWNILLHNVVYRYRRSK